MMWAGQQIYAHASQSALAAVTKYLRLGGLSNTFISHRSGVQQVPDQDEGKVGLVLRFLSLVAASHLPTLCSHDLFVHVQKENMSETKREGKRKRKGHSPSLMTSFKLTISLKALSPSTVALGVRTSTYKWGEAQFSPQCFNQFILNKFM